MTARETQRTAATYLSRYKTALAECNDIEKRIQSARTDMMSVRGISYDNADMPKAQSATSDLSDYIVRIDALIREWQSARDRALDLMLEITAAINAVEHDQARRVLMLHFVDGHSYEDIAERIPCGINSVYRWRRIGLMQIHVGSK